VSIIFLFSLSVYVHLASG